MECFKSWNDVFLLTSIIYSNEKKHLSRQQIIGTPSHQLERHLWCCKADLPS